MHMYSHYLVQYVYRVREGWWCVSECEKKDSLPWIASCTISHRFDIDETSIPIV
jgi:hypothetical protein